MLKLWAQFLIKIVTLGSQFEEEAGRFVDTGPVFEWEPESKQRTKNTKNDDNTKPKGLNNKMKKTEEEEK